MTRRPALPRGPVARVLAVLALALPLTLAIPIEEWRTGRPPLPPLEFAPMDAEFPRNRRLWIDTDAACGLGRTTDPDDCFAIALLARAPGVRIAGISTVFGNAPRADVDATTRELARRLALETHRPLPVYSGAAAADPATATPAHEAISRALEDGPLTFVALGPLTNLAGVLRAAPELGANVAELVAVMGRRPGQLFHPAEGTPAPSFLGHGPVFRDFNVAQDMRAVETIVAALPLTLIPYDAARGVEITGPDLARLERSPGAAGWIAAGARAWHRYWVEDIGRDGFYAFDLAAAAIVVEPGAFRCARVQAWVGPDRALFLPLLRPGGLLVDRPGATTHGVVARAPTRYCAEVSTGLKTSLIDRLHRP